MARPERATRGKRLSKLVDEEIEADEEFWNQDAFKEERADDEYEEEQEIADEFDSDFNDKEDESDDGEAEEKELRPKRKKTLPPGKKPVKKGPSGGSHKKKGVSFLEEAAAAADAGEALPTFETPRPAAVRPSAEEKEDEEGEKSLRKSTRTSVVVKQAEREAQRAIQLALPRIVKKKKEGEEKKMTQEEMLLEAAQTEIQNRQSLETLLAREEEVKRKAIINKEVYSGPLVRFYSKGGVNILEFIKMAEIPEVISAKALPYPKQPICVVTGLPAKYRDPKSGHPYATKEAFAILRERLRKGGNLSRDDSLEKVQRKRTRVERISGSRMGSVKIKFKMPERPKPSEEPKLQNPPAQSSSQPKPAEPLKQQPKPAPPPPAPAPAPLPRPMVEANEADFMLEDLEVSLPSNFDSGLMTSGEHVMNLSPTERYDLPMDGQSSHLLLDESWLHNT